MKKIPNLGTDFKTPEIFEIKKINKSNDLTSDERTYSPVKCPSDCRPECYCEDNPPDCFCDWLFF